MTLHEARRIARDIEINQLDYHWWSREQVHTAFHKLDMSDPTTLELRKEDMRLARVIWNAI